MSKVLFLSVPAHGNVNPTLGLVNELVNAGEEVIYFSSATFKDRIETTGAVYKEYTYDLDIFKVEAEGEPNKFFEVILNADKIVDDILSQVNIIQFDYIVHSAGFPLTKIITQVLKLPTVASLAVFAGLSNFFNDKKGQEEMFPGMEKMMASYQQTSARLFNKYGVEMPVNFMDLVMNKSDLNFVYTSDYFIAPADKAFFDDSYKFVGPPVYDKKEDLDFPFEKLQDRKVIYISLGTVFSNFNTSLYKTFFKSFGNTDFVVVLAAYNVDLSTLKIPANFIVRNYVPQNAILRYADVAITHCGMNSMNDLIYYHVPFVAIPLGADQPELAKRAEELGATISLNAEKITTVALNDAIDKVMNNPSYLYNINIIRQSFEEAGGYKKAVEEIFIWKKKQAIKNKMVDEVLVN